MENQKNEQDNKNAKKGFTLFAAKRITISIIIAIVAILAFTTGPGYVKKYAPTLPFNNDTVDTSKKPQAPVSEHSDQEQHKTEPDNSEQALEHTANITDQNTQPADTAHEPEKSAAPHPEQDLHQDTANLADQNTQPADTVHEPEKSALTKQKQDMHEDTTAHTAEQNMQHAEIALREPDLPGVALIKAAIKPLNYELTERFWGWRPNDIIDFTDNINNFQLGVLEVTRRTVVVLANSISRTGNTSAYDENLENAMNWIMVKANRYWFPSPESKYRACIQELEHYMKRLKNNEANFYARTDNLIPLLVAYQNLLGSCDENLVKTKEDDGTSVSTFSSDDYFFYAKGVASAMYTILSAVHHDFYETLEARKGASEVLHHAIESCHHAMEINPLLITNSSPGGILANHRANMAAPISHARFYLGVLIKTIST